MSRITFGRLDGNLRSPLIREMEHASGYAAEGDALEASLLCEVETRTVALSQLFFLILRWHTCFYDGTNCVNDVLGRQVIALGDHGFARFQESALQVVIALLSELDACCRVDAVVDAVVERCPTT